MLSTWGRIQRRGGITLPAALFFVAISNLGENMSHEPKPGEIVIEIDVESHSLYHYTDNFTVPPRKRTKMVKSGNSLMEFRPAGNNVRSRFMFNRCPGTQFPNAATQLDYIIGEYIHVDIEKRIGRITDPLGYASNKSMYESIKAVGADLGNMMPFPELTEDDVYLLNSDEKLWTWIYWMRRIVDGGCSDMRQLDEQLDWTCRPIQNVHTLPSFDEIVATRKVSILNNAEVTPKLGQWLHDVRRGVDATGRRMGEPEPGYDPQVDRDHLTPELFGAGVNR